MSTLGIPESMRIPHILGWVSVSDPCCSWFTCIRVAFWGFHCSLSTLFPRWNVVCRITCMTSLNAVQIDNSFVSGLSMLSVHFPIWVCLVVAVAPLFAKKVHSFSETAVQLLQLRKQTWIEYLKCIVPVTKWPRKFWIFTKSTPKFSKQTTCVPTSL